jgi:RimJ/RimL family protein N-acetyltransferase
MYKTERLTLTSFNKQSLETLMQNKLTNYYNWFMDQEITKYNSHGLFPQTEKDLENYFKSIDDAKQLVLSIHEKDTARHIGNISLQRFDWINRSAEFAVIIGEKDWWGKGVCTEAAKVLFKHAFEKLNLHRIWSGTADPNYGMRKVFHKLGMSHEGTFIDATFLNGKYENVVEYAILAEDYYTGMFLQEV